MCRVDYADEYWFPLKEPGRVTARKEHKCSNCARTIKPKEWYDSSTWADHGNGQLVTVKFCAHCRVAADWLDSVCGGFLYGEDQIAEDLQEHWDEEPQFQCRSFALLLSFMHKRWEGVPLKKAESLSRAATKYAMAQIRGAA